MLQEHRACHRYTDRERRLHEELESEVGRDKSSQFRRQPNGATLPELRVNLEPGINTPGIEHTPFVTADDLTLLFSRALRVGACFNTVGRIGI
jgi:hypothetical protein